MPRPQATTTRRQALALPLGLLAAPGLARAAEPAYPGRPIRLVVPFAAGSATDLRARLFAAPMAQDWGQPVVVDNRGGANGFLACETVAQAAPDGYTLLFTANTTHGSNPAMFRRLPYDPIADFTPVALLGSSMLFVVANNDLPVRSIAELIAYARAHPGKLNFASGSASSRAAGELFCTMAGVQMTNVAYRANPQGITDVIAGVAQVMFVDSTTATPQIREGRVRALGVTSRAPSPAMPEVPTVEAAGPLPGYEMATWTAVYGPARMDPAIVRKLNAKLVEIVQRPAIVQRLRDDGTLPLSSTPEELGQYTRDEIVKWRKIVADARIEIE
jgi:tripartite-type tricarboxylate transporter receptor subunit TctC